MVIAGVVKKCSRKNVPVVTSGPSVLPIWEIGSALSAGIISKMRQRYLPVGWMLRVKSGV